MHEISVINEIVKTVLEETRNYPNSKTESVTLKIGKLRQFVPEIMKFCYDVATRQTPLKNSELKLIEVPVEIFCRRCEMTTELDEFDFHCPECQSVDIQVVAGNELILESVQITEPVTADSTNTDHSKGLDYGT